MGCFLEVQKLLIGSSCDVNFRKISVRKTIWDLEICCKISCLPASPRIFEHLKNGIIAHFEGIDSTPTLDSPTTKAKNGLGQIQSFTPLVSCQIILTFWFKQCIWNHHHYCFKALSEILNSQRVITENILVRCTWPFKIVINRERIYHQTSCKTILFQLNVLSLLLKNRSYQRFRALSARQTNVLMQASCTWLYHPGTMTHTHTHLNLLKENWSNKITIFLN